VTLRSLDAPEEWTLYSVLAEIEALSLDLLEVRNHQDQFTTAHRDAHYRQVRRFRHHRSCLQPRALVPVVTPSLPHHSRRWRSRHGALGAAQDDGHDERPVGLDR
jgi:hypothetical protein